MIFMNPLVQVAVCVFLVGVASLLAVILIDNNRKVARMAWKAHSKVSWLFSDDDEDECPDWADDALWEESK